MVVSTHPGTVDSMDAHLSMLQVPEELLGLESCSESWSGLERVVPVS